MSRSTDLVFGAKEFHVRATTIGQLQKIELAMSAHAKEPSTGNVALAMKIIGIALERDHPDTAVDNLEATPPELLDAMKKVIALAGFDQKPEAASAAAAEG